MIKYNASWRGKHKHLPTSDGLSSHMWAGCNPKTVEYTAKHEMIGWHYEHAKRRSVTGINVVTCFCHRQGVSLPVWFERVRMTERSIDPNDGESTVSLREHQQRNRPRLIDKCREKPDSVQICDEFINFLLKIKCQMSNIYTIRCFRRNYKHPICR
ncbi:MAG: hypothetical protein KatS3mg054_1356 [Chloroflexus sp.]|nr:MAG: hypothetical protein KatS3mg054_1356 [Chloroflexus sp.]